jgi:diguanylate cyclase (GGDEF)-like protein
VLGTCVQAAATTALALSRASLLEQAQAAAATDGLTGVLNRRCFDQDLTWLVDVHRSEGRPFAVVMVDIDHFKQVNDGFGHLVGDQVLRSVAGLLRDLCGSRGATYRYGGEEFAVLLRGATAPEALDTAEAMRSELHRIHHPVQVTASFGVAAAPEAGTDGLAVVAAADAALLRAKSAGRDRVIVAAARMTGTAAVPAPRPDVVPEVFHS